MNKKPKLFRLSYKIAIMAVCLIIVSTSVIGIFSYFRYRERSFDMLTERLSYIAQFAASQVDPAEYREIMASGEKNDYYNNLVQAYNDIAEINGLYVLHAGELDPVTGFRGFIGPSEAMADLWQTIPPEAFPPEAYHTMANGEVTMITVPQDADSLRPDLDLGVFIVAYAPIFDESGSTIAIVSSTLADVGIYADSRTFAESIFGIVLAAIFVLIWIPLFFTRRSIGKPISKLSDATNAIVSGDLSSKIEIKTKDEFSVLAKNFMTMQGSIREKMEAERAANQAKLEKEKSEAVADAMRESITYASKIQRNLLPQDVDMAAVFSDYSVIWKPRDIVGGDVYWMKQFKTGTVLCVADCTGHGTPGALLTTLVTSALESIVWEGNCDDTADIIWQLDRRLSGVLHVDKETEARRGIMDIDDGCDVVIIFVAGDKSVQFSSGNIPVFICNGEKVTQHKGQKLFVGEGKIKNSTDVKAVYVPADPKNKFYIASDGLFDQIGRRPGGSFEHGIQFGYEVFKLMILENHNEKQSVITAKVWDAYEQYMGDEAQRDDFELVAFKP